MAGNRVWYINGESMVYVKGRQDSAIGSLQELGLTEGPIQITVNYKHRDINLDAYGGEVPPEVQFFLADATIQIDLINVDVATLNTCIAESTGGTTIGTFPRAGALLGNYGARFAGGGINGNHYIGLNIASPVATRPWRFLTTYMTGPPFAWPLGTEKSVIRTTWRAIPYAADPWNNGNGALDQVLWDYTADN